MKKNSKQLLEVMCSFDPRDPISRISKVLLEEEKKGQEETSLSKEVRENIAEKLVPEILNWLNKYYEIRGYFLPPESLKILLPLMEKNKPHSIKSLGENVSLTAVRIAHLHALGIVKVKGTPLLSEVSFTGKFPCFDKKSSFISVPDFKEEKEKNSVINEDFDYSQTIDFERILKSDKVLPGKSFRSGNAVRICNALQFLKRESYQALLDLLVPGGINNLLGYRYLGKKSLEFLNKHLHEIGFFKEGDASFKQIDN